MRWVQRDKNMVIIGDYANRQPGYAEESLDESDPELAIRLVPAPQPKNELTKLIDLLVEKDLITQQEADVIK